MLYIRSLDLISLTFKLLFSIHFTPPPPTPPDSVICLSSSNCQELLQVMQENLRKSTSWASLRQLTMKTPLQDRKGQFLPFGTSKIVPEGGAPFLEVLQYQVVNRASSYSNSLLQKSI